MSYVDPTLPNPGAGGLPGAYVFEGSGTGRLGGNSPQSIFKKAFGPRVGLAYSVDPNTVIRAGYGIYFSTQRIGGFAEDDSQGFFSSYTYPTPASIQTPVVVLSQITAYPGKQPPFIDPTVMNGNGNALFLESKVDRPGTIQNWTLDVQRQLPLQTIVDVAYVGAHGDHLQAFLHDPNQGIPSNMARGACLQVNIANQVGKPACAGQSVVAAPYAGFSGTVSQALRPFPQYGTVTVDSATMDDPFGDYTYHALQVQVTKRISSGLTVLANYSWSKNITNADSEYPTEAAWEGNGTSGALNTYNLKVEKALSQSDIPQRVVLAWTYDLPFGKGKTVRQSRRTRQRAGWWMENCRRPEVPKRHSSKRNFAGLDLGHLRRRRGRNRFIQPSQHRQRTERWRAPRQVCLGSEPPPEPGCLYSSRQLHLWRRAPCPWRARTLQHRRGLQRHQGHPDVHRTGPHRLPRGVLRPLQPTPLHRL